MAWRVTNEGGMEGRREREVQEWRGNKRGREGGAEMSWGVRLTNEGGLKGWSEGGVEE